jgi:hypothetical protein
MGLLARGAFGEMVERANSSLARNSDRLQHPELRGCNCPRNVMLSSLLANTTQTHANEKATP